MRIIGVDPGLACTGVGIIEIEDQGSRNTQRDRTQFIHTELLRPPRTELAQRLLYLHDHLIAAIHEWHCDMMAVEDQFFGTNIQTAFKTGQARGAALLAAAQCELKVALYAPARVKMAVVGNGQASKEQVRYVIAQILRLPKGLQPMALDCSDALAVALCHANATQTAALIPPRKAAEA